MLIPHSNDRAVFIGPTQSGKTTLARQLLAFYRNVIVVDPKHQWQPIRDTKSPTGFTYPHDPKYVALAGQPIYFAKDLSELEKVMDKQIDHPYHILYRVPSEHLLRKGAEQLDRVAQLTLDRGHTTLYYDELYYVASGNDFADRAPHYFYCVTTGAWKKVGVWASVQRPTWIPLIALTETEVRATFYLRGFDDRRRVEKVFGDGIPWKALEKFRHSFVMADDTEITPYERLVINNQTDLPLNSEVA